MSAATKQTKCQECAFKGELLAHLKGIKNEINNGFKDIRSNIDKVERDQYKQWDKIGEISVLTGQNAVKIEGNSEKISSVKYVLYVLITLSITNLGFLINLAIEK